MPVYNSGEYLKTAVESILSQSLKEIELILVDDGSTDGSSERCDEYAKKDKRVVVIHQQNGGICNARNSALKIAQGEYLAFSDHDDEYLPDFLLQAYMKAKKHDADLVKVGKVEFILKNDKVIRKKQSNLPAKVYSKDDIRSQYFELVDSDELDCLWDGLFKKRLIDQIGIKLDERYKNGGEDIDFIQRLLPYINTFVTIDKIYYNHYIRRGFSTSAKFNISKHDSKRLLMKTMLSTIHKLGVNLETNQFAYTYHLLRQYIAPVCALYSNSNCVLSINEKANRIQSISTESFYRSFCIKQRSIKVFAKSRKYGLLYFLYKHKMYKTILKMYSKRNS